MPPQTPYTIPTDLISPPTIPGSIFDEELIEEPPVIIPEPYLAPSLAPPALTAEEQSLLSQPAYDLIPGAPAYAQYPSAVAQDKQRQIEEMKQAEISSAPTIPSTIFPAPVDMGAAPLAPGQTDVQGERELGIARNQDRRASAYTGAQQAIDTLGRFDEAIDASARELLSVESQLSVETDPARAQQLQQKHVALRNQITGLEQIRGEAQRSADMELAKGQVAVQLGAQENSRLIQEQVLEDLKTDRQKRMADIERKRTDRELAQKSAADKKRQYVDLLRQQAAGDSATTWSAVASMVGELFQAYAENRPPNLAASIENILALGREKLHRQREASLADLEVADEAIDDISLSIKDIEMDGAAADAAILEQARAAVDLEMLKAQGTPREVALFQAQRALEQAQAAAEADAATKAEAADLERRKAESEIALKEAQAKKTLSEIKGYGGGGFGMGGRKAGAATDPSLSTLPKEDREKIEKLGVRDPISGVWLRTESGGYVVTSDPKTASELRARGGAVREYTDLAGQLANLAAGGMTSSKWTSEDQKQINSIYADLKVVANKAAKLGALDNGTLAVLEDLITGGVTPGSFGASVDVILNAAQRMQKSFSGSIDDESVSGNHAGISFPDLSIQRGRIEAAARASAGEASLGKDRDLRVNPTPEDPTGLASQRYAYADAVRADLQTSKNAIQKVKENRFSSGARVPEGIGIPASGGSSIGSSGIPFTAARQEELRGLVEMYENGDRSPETVSRIQGLLREAHLIGPDQNFIDPNLDSRVIDAVTGTMETQADAIRAAQWLKDNSKTTFDLQNLRNRKIVRGEYASDEDKKKFRKEVEAAYAHLTDPEKNPIKGIDEVVYDSTQAALETASSIKVDQQFLDTRKALEAERDALLKEKDQLEVSIKRMSAARQKAEKAVEALPAGPAKAKAQKDLRDIDAEMQNIRGTFNSIVNIQLPTNEQRLMQYSRPPVSQEAKEAVRAIPRPKKKKK